MKLKETEVKYLAGLIDSDGSIGFSVSTFEKKDGTVQVIPRITVVQGKAGHAVISHFAGRIGIPVISAGNEKLAIYIQGRRAIALFDRISKYLVVKGVPYKFAVDNAGHIAKTEYPELRERLIDARRMGGPVKPINFVSMSWIAGFLDGDGSYTLRQRRTKFGMSNDLNVRVGVTKVEKVHALKLLYKTLGGTIRLTPDKRGYYRWHLSLGKGNRQRAIRFLREMRKRSFVKVAKIEQMLKFHEDSHRLNPMAPKGEVTVEPI